MPFDYPEEDQEQDSQQKLLPVWPVRGFQPGPEQNAGVRSPLAVRLGRMLAGATASPNANGPFYERVFPPAPPPAPKPKLGIAQQIFAKLAKPPSPKEEEQAKAKSLGQRLLTPRPPDPSRLPRLREVPNGESWTPPQRPQPPATVSTTRTRFSLSPQQYGSFSSFIPAGTPSPSRLASSRATQNQSGGTEALGRSAGKAVGAMADVVPGEEELISPASSAASNLVKVQSPIPRPKTAPDVRPNLNPMSPKQTQRSLDRTLSGLMQSIRHAQPPQADRHLPQDDLGRVARLAYSEDVPGTVAENEAIISAILNRVRSGDRQYIDHGQSFTVANVIEAHTRRGIHQFQGIDNEAYSRFPHATDRETQNARTAAENIAAHGPTTRATHFIVKPPGKTPSKEEVRALGHVTYLGHEGNVFLYEYVAPRPAHHPHPRAVPQNRIHRR